MIITKTTTTRTRTTTTTTTTTTFVALGDPFPCLKMRIAKDMKMMKYE